MPENLSTLSKKSLPVVHKHKWTMGEEGFACELCGKSVPNVERIEAEDPPLSMWVKIEKMGGMSGRALYFRRYLDFRLARWISTGGDGVRYTVRNLPGEDSFPGDYEPSQDRILAILDTVEYHLTLSNDSLMDSIFPLMDKQREIAVESKPPFYVDGVLQHGAMEGHALPLSLVRIEVRSGKILRLAFEEVARPKRREMTMEDYFGGR